MVADEVEEHVHLVAELVTKEQRQLVDRLVCLGQQDRIAAPPGHERAQVAEVVVRIGNRRFLAAGLFDQEGNGVDAEAR